MKSNKLGSGAGNGHRTLKVEQLEGRMLLAGNVLVSTAGGQLFITGDNNDNAVVVSEIDDGNANDNRHSYLIAGFNFDNAPPGSLPGGIDFQGGNTTIRGAGTAVAAADLPAGAVSARVVRGITGNVIIDMKGGDDVLALGNSVDDLLALADECGFGFGLGSGSFSFGNPSQEEPGEFLEVERSLIIKMGNGDDTVGVIANVGTAVGGGSLVIDTGAGNDAVAFGQADAQSEIFDDPTVGIGGAGSIAVATGGGNDAVCMEHFVTFGGLAVDTGANSDLVDISHFDAYAATVNAGNGANQVFLFDAQIFVDIDKDFTPFNDDDILVEPTGPLTVVTGSGNDVVDVDAVLALTIVVSTGAGDDGSFEADLPIEIDNCTVIGDVVLNTGPGNDEAEVLNELEEIDREAGEGIIHGSLTIVLGSGDDELFLGDTDGDDLVVGRNLTVDAGLGNDFVDIENALISLITTIQMNLGDDRLDIFNSGTDTNIGRLIADGGPGFDEFNNDLGVDGNGNFGADGNGAPTIIVRRFEEFNLIDILAPLLSPTTGKKKVW